MLSFSNYVWSRVNLKRPPRSRKYSILKNFRTVRLVDSLIHWTANLFDNNLQGTPSGPELNSFFILLIIWRNSFSEKGKTHMPLWQPLALIGGNCGKAVILNTILCCSVTKKELNVLAYASSPSHTGKYVSKYFIL